MTGTIEAALGADGDADVVEVILHEVVAFHAAIHVGHGLERARPRL